MILFENTTISLTLLFPLIKQKYLFFFKNKNLTFIYIFYVMMRDFKYDRYIYNIKNHPIKGGSGGEDGSTNNGRPNSIARVQIEITLIKISKKIKKTSIAHKYVVVKV